MAARHLASPLASPYRRHSPERVDPRALVFKDLKADQLTEIERLIAKLEGTLAAVLRRALERQRDAVALGDVLTSLQAGNFDRVLQLLNAEPALGGFKAVEPALQDGVYAAGTLTAATISQQLKGVDFVFGRLNPTLISTLQRYAFDLVRQVNQQTIDSIRATMVGAMTAGRNPKAAAVQIKGAIGLTQRQAKAVANYRRELETFHEKRSAGGYNLGAKIDRVNGTQVFRPAADGAPQDGILERRLRDFRYDGVLQRSLDSGSPLKPEQIDRMVDAYERKYLAYRARTIARTEATRANNAGIQEAWRQAIEQGKVSEDLVRRQWIVARDERSCAICAAIPGLNPKRGVKMNQPFDSDSGPLLAPPAHPSCRCTQFIRQWEPEQLAAD